MREMLEAGAPHQTTSESQDGALHLVLQRSISSIRKDSQFIQRALGIRQLVARKGTFLFVGTNRRDTMREEAFA
jgi:hypothetical protein